LREAVVEMSDRKRGKCIRASVAIRCDKQRGRTIYGSTERQEISDR